MQLKLKESSKSSITVSALKNLEAGADIFACDLSKNSTTDVQNSIKSTYNSNISKMKDIKINEAPTESYGASFTPAAAETIKQLLINAGKDMKKKALRSARVSFETILQLDSQNLHARLGLAEIYLRNRKYSKIVSTLLPSPDNSKSPPWSSNSKVLEYLGDAFYYQKKYKESLKAYDTSLHSILQENVIKSGVT